MKAGKYNIKELFINRNIESIIIPEIQRDYVWGKDQIDGLLKSLFDDYNNFMASCSNVNIQIDDNESIQNSLLNHYKSIKFGSSIGFIYAYSDREYPDKYFLIDGQQRLTTIYLLITVIASMDEEFKIVFNKLYFSNQKSFIEYRVREASLLFLNKAISEIIESGQFELKDKFWYYDFYKSDKTIQSTINALQIIKSNIEYYKINICSFKDYLLDYVQFWYFDTNISEQGEELYVYMNARGTAMQSNENLKAELLSQIDSKKQKEKNEWGTKWEIWQDTFWLIRGENENADNVFNEFTYCIAGLQNIKLGLNINIEKNDKPTHLQLLKCFDSNGLEILENYVGAFELLLGKELEDFCTYRKLYSVWIKSIREIIRQVFNKNFTNWFANIDDQNRSTERNRMVLVWSVLDYLMKKNTIDTDTIIVLRIFYNRYHNFDRAVKSNLNDVDKFINETYKSIVRNNQDAEEVLKFNYIQSIENQLNFGKLITIIWQIEDHPINLSGRDVKNLNSSHLIDYQSDLDENKLTLIKDKFYELFPLKEGKANEVDWINYKKVLSALITYGKFWNKKITNGYLNIDFDNESRIIRDIDSNNKCFNNFFNDFIATDSLDDLLKDKLLKPLYDAETEDLELIIKWYNYELKEKMWDEGFYIAIGNYNHQKVDKYFPENYRLVNTKGNFNGGDPVILYKQINKKE
jgi:hypothetical protein